MNNLKVLENKLIPVYITDEGEKVVNARELHEYLGVDTRFRTWIKRKVENYSFEENLDFISFLGESTGGRPPKEYYLSIKAAQIICRKSKMPKSPYILKELINSSAERYVIKPLKREEYYFKQELESIFNGIAKVEHQYRVSNYRIDFYIPRFNLAIEFDEHHHQYQKNKDKIRQQKISDILNCKFIRVGEKEKVSFGINKILREILNFKSLQKVSCC